MLLYLQMLQCMLLLCPFAKGLQALINICINYGHCHDILNPSKICCMLFQTSKNKVKGVPGMHVYENVIRFVDM